MPYKHINMINNYRRIFVTPSSSASWSFGWAIISRGLYQLQGLKWSVIVLRFKHRQLMIKMGLNCTFVRESGYWMEGRVGWGWLGGWVLEGHNVVSFIKISHKKNRYFAYFSTQQLRQPTEEIPTKDTIVLYIEVLHSQPVSTQQVVVWQYFKQCLTAEAINSICSIILEQISTVKRLSNNSWCESK